MVDCSEGMLNLLRLEWLQGGHHEYLEMENTEHDNLPMKATLNSKKKLGVNSFYFMIVSIRLKLDCKFDKINLSDDRFI